MTIELKDKAGLAAIAGILLFAFVCRFWGLSRFNAPVFDEVYFAQYGYDYLNRTEFFDVHPPLGKYIIAIGIWTFQRLSSAPEIGDAEGVARLSAFSYRWVGAAFGTLIPLWVGILAYLLGRRWPFALLAGALTALDGLLLVESRYALINTYLLTFGLLGQIFFLLAIASSRRRALWLVLSGVGFGASWAVKWNGLGFLMAAYGFYGLALIWRWLVPARPLVGSSADDVPSRYQAAEPLLRGAARVPIPLFALALGVIPAIVYRLSWVYHLQIAPEFNFLEMQQQILGYHSRVGGNTAETHPYCSSWFSWPWMLRPVGYYFQQWEEGDRPIVTDVHALGTPVLWWLATLATIAMLAIAAFWFWRALMKSGTKGNAGGDRASSAKLATHGQLGIVSFLACGYGANYLPWALVSRCTYLYHYMAASLFSFLALAWVLDRLWKRRDPAARATVLTVFVVCAAAFAFWLPVFLGLPLSREAFDLRMWLESWY